jgi:glutathione S-transferase
MTLMLVSHHLCPYVQRVAIALAEKNTPFERTYIDLANKPNGGTRWLHELRSKMPSRATTIHVFGNF